MDHAVIRSTKGNIYIMQIVFPDKKLSIFDGTDENGKIKVRDPKVMDFLGGDNGDYIDFIGTQNECREHLKQIKV